MCVLLRYEKLPRHCSPFYYELHNMMQFIALNNHELFSEISHRESATISGGQNSSNSLGVVALTAGVLLLMYGVTTLMSEMRNSTDISF